MFTQLPKVRQNLLGRKLIGVLRSGDVFRAQISRLGVTFYLGIYQSSPEAADAHDRAALLSRPWVTRTTYLNNPDFKLPESYALNASEQAMVARLRSMDLSAELSYNNQSQVEALTPEELRRQFNNLAVEQRGFAHRFERFMASVSTFADDAANERFALVQEVARLNGENREMQAELSQLNGLAPDEQTKFCFRPIEDSQTTSGSSAQPSQMPPSEVSPGVPADAPIPHVVA